ncbi:GspE/PulE family protein [Clostridium paraputrificum]|uniref:GspE/PulE family protein n=1 Tax=Clostridium paraputrificum TaxID=29363 RepID=UPI003D34A458
MIRTKKRLGDILVQAGKISQADLITALKKQALSGRRLGEILVADGIASEEDILAVLELQLGIKRVNLEFLNIEDSAIRRVPEAVSKRYTLMPIKVDGNTIQVAMSDPFNLMAIEDIRLATGLNVEKVLDSKTSIMAAIKKYYTKQYAEQVAKDLGEKDKAEKKVQVKSATSLAEEEATKDAPVVKLVDTIIQNAVRMKASDIHIEPFENEVRVRVRVDGELQKILKVPKESQNTLSTRIKILADLNIAEKRVPQDGRILTNVDGVAIDLRVSVLPTVNGEKIVIRILSKNSSLMNKESLGMHKDDMDKLTSIMQNPYGIILVTGPTGSGKSTTLYTVLSELNTINKNIITVEDPVEFMIEGINQVAVNNKAGLTFASGLRSILRQDPDIVMVGEIRDGETAEIAIRAAITGHVVLSTLHTNDAPSTIARLIDMGIEPYLISTSVNGIIAQRLVRKVCGKCSKPYFASDYEKRVLGVPLDANIKLVKGEGCPLCNGTGYKGRIGIYEILDIKRELRTAITEEETSDVLRDIAIKGGMKTLKKACVEHVLECTTTIDEFMRVAFLKE